MRLFAIDPGPHTGIFYSSDRLGEFRFNSLTLDFTEVAQPMRTLWRWLDNHVDEDQIILESFEFRKEDAKNREYIDYSTGEFVGCVKTFCQLRAIPYVMQSASEAKGFWTDDKLKRVEFWEMRGTRHERDAARHWLHYQTFKANDLQWLEKLK